MAGERAKDNKTLVAKCTSCEKAVPAVELVGMKILEGGKRKVISVCRACRDKGFRPPGYTGY